MPYEVVRYETRDEPIDASFISAGTFATAAEALAVAQEIVDQSLRELLPSSKDAEDLQLGYACAGEGVMIHGETNTGFHTYKYADARAIQIFKDLNARGI